MSDYEARTELIVSRYRKFSKDLANELKCGNSEVDLHVKNALVYDAFQQDCWRSDRLSDIGR